MSRTKRVWLRNVEVDGTFVAPRTAPYPWVCGNPKCTRGEGGVRATFQRIGPQGCEFCPECATAVKEGRGRDFDPDLYAETRGVVQARPPSHGGKRVATEREALKRAGDGERINPKAAGRWLDQFFE